MRLGQHGVAGPVLDLPPDHRTVPDDGVGVELDDEIRGARAHQLRRRDGGRGNCGGEEGRIWTERIRTKDQSKSFSGPKQMLLEGGGDVKDFSFFFYSSSHFNHIISARL